MLYRAVQRGTVQCSVVQHSIVQHSVVQYSDVQDSVVQWLPSAGLRQVLVRDKRWSSPV